MKTKLFFFALLIFSPAFAQESDTLQHRNGLVLDYNGYLIENLGFKYRLTSSWTPFIKLMYSYHSNSSSNEGFDPAYSRNTFQITAGTEYTIFRFAGISLLALSSLGYAYTNTSPIHNLTPTGETGSTYSVTVGIAAEYFISKQFSIAGYETAVFSYSDINYSTPKISEIGRSLTFGHVNVSINYYF
jgi:hypothetical protein